MATKKKKYNQNLKDSPFTAEQKAIFKFKDGEKTRGVDPLDIHLAFSSLDYDWEAAGKKVEDGCLETLASLIENTRKVFKLAEKEYTEDDKEIGASSTEVMEVLYQFTTYMSHLKKTTEESQTSQPNTDSTPPK